MTIAWQRAMASILEAQEDIKELVSKWKELMSSIPQTITFNFFDGQSFSIPNFAKIMGMLGSVTSENIPNSLVLRGEDAGIRAENFIIQEFGQESVSLTKTRLDFNSVSPSYGKVNIISIIAKDDSGSPLPEIKFNRIEGQTAYKTNLTDKKFEITRGQTGGLNGSIVVDNDSGSIVVNRTTSSGGTNTNNIITIDTNGMSYAQNEVTNIIWKFGKEEWDLIQKLK
jgi:hypothetical protein